MEIMRTPTSLLGKLGASACGLLLVASSVLASEIVLQKEREEFKVAGGRRIPETLQVTDGQRQIRERQVGRKTWRDIG